MSEKVLDRIDDKMTMLVRLVSLNIVKGRPFTEQIELLNNAGLAPAEIATILGKTPNNIRVQLHYIRKRKGEKAEEMDE
jgi:hypothetical protein